MKLSGGKMQEGIQGLKGGEVLDFGWIVISEEEAIEFAKQFDPVYLHIDREAAKKGPFGRIITSGPHAINIFHKREWIPRFGNSLIGGVEISNWKYYRPIFPGDKVFCKCRVAYVKRNNSAESCLICWEYILIDEKGEIYQVAHFLTMHSLK